MLQSLVLLSQLESALFSLQIIPSFRFLFKTTNVIKSSRRVFSCAWSLISTSLPPSLLRADLLAHSLARIMAVNRSDDIILTLMTALLLGLSLEAQTKRDLLPDSIQVSKDLAVSHKFLDL